MEAREVYEGYKPTVVGKHQAPNNVHLKAVVDRLVAAGDLEAADTIVWLMWHRDIAANREKLLNEWWNERIAEKELGEAIETPPIRAAIVALDEVRGLNGKPQS
ncbi:hypothetical protein [Sphingomonas sp. NIC1]|uniref:hypothetical protein n=1 Tax=Sphingomonas sp. NIC1 TaxID=1961362 RepID=UPI0007C0F207|nr:hypothetical protein [Sphingomonas sp. NIC1]ANC85481.1 hypothetical protein A7E77_00340 [Sphingomonas sp. NIC1]